MTLGHIGTLGPCNGVIFYYTMVGYLSRFLPKLLAQLQSLLPTNSLNLDNANVQNDSLDSTVFFFLAWEISILNHYIFIGQVKSQFLWVNKQLEFLYSHDFLYELY